MMVLLIKSSPVVVSVERVVVGMMQTDRGRKKRAAAEMLNLSALVQSRQDLSFLLGSRQHVVSFRTFAAKGLSPCLSTNGQLIVPTASACAGMSFMGSCVWFSSVIPERRN